MDFNETFRLLTGNAPFPWQQALYQDWFAAGRFPDACILPTGLGKTSVIAVWLIALANGKPVPRRLVYVVNRRTVVDQTTDEAEKYRKNAGVAGIELPAISTLRGQFADNREWSADPSKPAIIAGTVDMIGSRLLFNGYGVGFKSKPLHAGFLGQDVLLIHDEAHLEPAFQKLIEGIRDEQKREPAPLGDQYRLQVMELTATSRAGEGVFPNKAEREHNEKHPIVQKRVNARKAIHLRENEDEKKLPDEVTDLALRHDDSNLAVLVFVRTVTSAGKVAEKLRKAKKQVETLTGTIRGKERDELVLKPIFQRFLPPSNRDKDITPAEGTVYLVCTSAGEVGVNISADHLVCDLSTFESMAQRFGRVNRFGDCPDTRIDIVYPAELPSECDISAELKKEEAKRSGKLLVDGARRRTLDLLQTLDNGSPAALGNLDQEARLAAFSPAPRLLDTSDILFDLWALSTIRDRLPGRPVVEPYLHGEATWQPPETYVGWREEVALLGDGRLTARHLRELFDEYPPKPHELLRDQTARVFDQLEAIAERVPTMSAWVIDADGKGQMFVLSNLVERDRQKKPVVDLDNCTVLLPPRAGGRAGGMLNGEIAYLEDEKHDYDVAGQPSAESVTPMVRLVVVREDGELVFRPVAQTRGLTDFEMRVDDDLKESERARQLRKALQDAEISPMRAALRFDISHPDSEDEGSGPNQYLVMKPERNPKQLTRPEEWPTLDQHREGVRGHARAICQRLGLPENISRAVELAAKWHDLGKGRSLWQRGAGNRPGQLPVSKPIHGRPPENLNGFRHELASLVDVHTVPEVFEEFESLQPGQRELALHLVAAHHGRARPHFPARESTDAERPEIASESITADTPSRFAHLHRQYGRWGLAYLESLLRAADVLDSQRIEDTPIGEPQAGEWMKPPSRFVWPARPPKPEPTISVNVDATNPGQFFACCGLLELADRLWPGTQGWFADNDGQFHMSGTGSLAELVQKIVDADVKLLDEDIYSGRVMVGIGSPPLILDWWHEAGGPRDAKDLKVWAGTMESHGIARAMQQAMRGEPFRSTDLFDVGIVVSDADDARKKKEPYYFDARRATNAHSRDVGFSTNDLGLTTTAFPAVEFLCLVGLQRCLPARNGDTRIYHYFTWSQPLVPMLLPAAAPGLLPCVGGRGYRFENWFRTGQRKHKAFRPAISFSPQGVQ